MSFLEIEDVISLLRAEVGRAGSLAAWGRSAGVDRSLVSAVLHGRRRLSKKMLKALRIRIAFVQGEQ